MSKRPLAIFAILAALSLGTPAMADHGHGDSKNDHGNKHSDDDDDRGWEHRDGYEYRTYGDRDGRPPGWSRGKKTAWGNCGLPPGQAKKYQDEQGQIIVRRPLIEVQGSINIVP
jgi:hypothetical protein